MSHVWKDATLCISQNATDTGNITFNATPRAKPLDANWHDFAWRRADCNKYQQLADVHLQKSQSSPVLICAVRDGIQGVNVSILDAGVCTDRNHACAVPDTLSESDHNSFDALGHKAIVQGIVWCFAISAVFGNIAVIAHCAPLLVRNFKKLAKTEKVHRWLVLNLAVSDFLMGTYIAMYGLAHRHHDHEYSSDDRYKWLSSSTCSAMGVISFVSSQMSVSMLVIITSFRLDSVASPFREDRKQFKTAVFVTILAWVVWSVYAVVPFLPFESVRVIFDNFVKIKSVKCFEQTDMHYDYLVAVMRKVNDFIDTNCGSQIASSYSVSNEPDWLQLLQIGRNLDIFDADDQPEFFGYYNEQSVCTAKYFVTHTNRSAFFTLVVVMFNTLSFLYILLAYTFVWRQTIRQREFASRWCCWPCRNPTIDPNKNLSDRRSREDRNMQMRIIIIIATDFLCWVPLCGLSLFHFVKSTTYTDQNCDYHSYMNIWQGRFSLLTLILLPINSAINPFIYSFRYWGFLRKRVLGFVSLNQETTDMNGDRI